MSRLSRDKKRDHQRPERPAAPAPPTATAAPIQVHVHGDAGPGSASVGGVRVVAAPGEEIQQTVLNHLHRIALTTAHEVHATIHDTRIGYVVPLRVTPDGSSDFRGEPVRMAPPAETKTRWDRGAQGKTGETGAPRGSGAAGEAGASTPTPVPEQPPTWPEPPTAAPSAPGEPDWPATPGEPGRHEASRSADGLDVPDVFDVRDVREGPVWPAPAEDPLPAEGSVPADVPEGSVLAEGPEDAVPAYAPVQSGTPAASDVVRPQWAQRDKPAHLQWPAEEPVQDAVQDGVRDAASTFPMRAVPMEEPTGDEAVPTFTLRTLPQPPQPPTPGPAPGTVAAPMGVFGPPPVMDTHAAPPPAPEHRPMTVPQPTPTPPKLPAPPTLAAPRPAPLPLPMPEDLDPVPKPTPPRGFDAVAEAVLGEGPLTAPGDDGGPALLAEPMGRINEAVKAGRTDDAAELADRTMAQASEALGTEHPEMLRLRELAAYIAYLAGDPARALHLSLDLARVHRATPDAEAAYGNVQSAFTAWRAVRDPQLGLDLGHELIALWSELTTDQGPAADDIEQLEKARARMDRLAGRVRDSG
ncbi:tetratricopeptide repeat protein [Streptomyces sp. LBL]|uniref:tetratricopeptide repeat protein n=1 Tax=Streptomyces sp. LBL TaxID=2940562 RepID=UPI0024754D25|nr:tetratricopeptide repeat protein [Streptomyces sp. LBL]